MAKMGAVARDALITRNWRAFDALLNKQGQLPGHGDQAIQNLEIAINHSKQES